LCSNLAREKRNNNERGELVEKRNEWGKEEGALGPKGEMWLGPQALRKGGHLCRSSGVRKGIKGKEAGCRKRQEEGKGGEEVGHVKKYPNDRDERTPGERTVRGGTKWPKSKSREEKRSGKGLRGKTGKDDHGET